MKIGSDLPPLACVELWAYGATIRVLILESSGTIGLHLRLRGSQSSGNLDRMVFPVPSAAVDEMQELPLGGNVT